MTGRRHGALMEEELRAGADGRAVFWANTPSRRPLCYSYRPAAREL